MFSILFISAQVVNSEEGKVEVVLDKKLLNFKKYRKGVIRRRGKGGNTDKEINMARGGERSIKGNPMTHEFRPRIQKPTKLIQEEILKKEKIFLALLIFFGERLHSLADDEELQARLFSMLPDVREEKRKRRNRKGVSETSRREARRREREGYGEELAKGDVGAELVHEAGGRREKIPIFV
jgi:hypothetical protein